MNIDVYEQKDIGHVDKPLQLTTVCQVYNKTEQTCMAANSNFSGTCTIKLFTSVKNIETLLCSAFHI